MNLTNLQHAFYGILMLLPFAVIGHPEIGCAWSIAWFVSREHTQRQTDIKNETGIGVAAQNPLKGFRGWSLDSKLDALFPAVICIIATVGYYVVKG